jgi:hypothetical protein
MNNSTIFVTGRGCRVKLRRVGDGFEVALTGADGTQHVYACTAAEAAEIGTLMHRLATAMIVP